MQIIFNHVRKSFLHLFDRSFQVSAVLYFLMGEIYNKYNLKSFQNIMNSQYFKNFINIKEQSKAAYQSYLTRIKQCFEIFTKQPNNVNCLKFHAQLSKLKDFKDLKHKDRKEIFKYCVEQNIKELLFFRSSNNRWLAIMKLTKTSLDNYQLDWKTIWNQLISQQPQVPTMKLYTDIKDYLTSIRHLYDPNNAVDVLNHFISKHSSNQNSYLFITLFSNLSRKTSRQTMLAYIKRLFQLYDTNQVKAGNLLVMFINACKYKYQEIPSQMYEQFNKIILYSLTTPISEKKDTIQNKFNTQTVDITIKIIGKSNQHSVYLLQKIFQLIKNFIRPFQDSKKPLKFLYKLIKGITKRIQRQDNGRIKIQKLKAKDEKRKNKIMLKKQQQQKQKLEEKVCQQTVSRVEDEEQSTITRVEQNEQVKKEIKKSQQEEDSDEDNQDDDESQEQQQRQKLQTLEKLMGMQLQQDQTATQKVTQIHTKIQNLQALLRNQITNQIKSAFKSFIDSIFQDVFYINSKKIVHKMLFEIFKIYPQFINRAFQSLDKAANIPQINEQGLISNINCMAKYLFVPQYRQSPAFLENVIKTLTKIQQNRKISDVWSIINIFTQKIPLLDEKDYQLINQQQKNQFQKKFFQNHDKFYQTYSQIIFQCLKRLFSQSEHFDQNTSITIDKYLIQLFSNCHKNFKIRVLKQIQEQICQNNNRFLISVLHSYIKPNKQLQQELRELVQNRNIDNQQNLQLDILVNIVLSANMEIEDLKKIIKKYSKKNNYKFIKQCMMNLTNYSFLVNPIDSSLSYLNSKPTITITQQPSYNLISTKLQHVSLYSQELISSLLEELNEFQDKTLKNGDYYKIVEQLYQSKENNYKNMKVQKRKLINELLQILRIIMQNLEHELQQYNSTTNTIDYKKAPYQRSSLLLNDKFVKIFNSLIYNEIFLHDHNIMNNLSLLLENEVFFMYKHQLKLQKDTLNKYQKAKKQELSGQINIHSINNIYITKARIIHLSQLYNKYRYSVDISSFQNQFKLLLLAPGNEKSSQINKIFINKFSNLQSHAEFLINLLSLSLDSRFYYEKVFTLLKELNQSGYQYNTDQIIKIVDYHAPLLQSQNIKIRQHSLKSFQRFIGGLNKNQIIGKVQNQFRKYINKQKSQIIWIIFVIIVLKQPIRSITVQYYLSNIKQYLQILSKLITSQMRLLRRIALFTYSLCLRKAKSAVKTYQLIQCQNIQYSQFKDIYQIFQDGYIREDHKALQNISNKSILKKLSPYSQYSIKKKNYYAIYQEIQAKSYDFIMNDLDVGDKILRLYHTDMAGSLEQAMAVLQGKKLDLSQITFKLLEGSYVYCKLKKLNFDKIQYYFGQRFFRYLLDKDGKSGFNFFLKTKTFFDDLMQNFESYDNQNLIFIYTMDLMLSYEKHFKQTPRQISIKIEQFLLKIMRQIIYKGSGALFKKLLIIIDKIQNIQSINFLSKYLNILFQNKQKLSRVVQLLTKIHVQNYKKYLQMIRYLLSQKIQLNNNYIIILIQDIINLPEKYVLQDNQIDKYKFIDKEKQLLQKHIQKYHQNFYILNTHSFNTFLVDKLAEFLLQTQEINQKLQNLHKKSQSNGQNYEKQSLELLKQKNQWIKIIFSIVIHSINAYIQFYQTQQTINTIIALLDILFKLFQFKMELIIDFKVLEDIFKGIFSNKFQNIGHFQTILNIIVGNIQKLSVKKQAEIVHIIAHRPGNFLFMHQKAYVAFIKQIIALEDNFMIYKELLVNLSTILAYIPLTEAEINSILTQIPKNQKILLMQCYVLSSLNIGSSFTDKILKESGKERRNIFCKQLLAIRGKRQYLDNEQKYNQWKQIKQYSNPYHYHA